MFKKAVIELLAKQVPLKKEEIERLIEIPQQQFGDFAFPCFTLASKFKKNPVVIAKEIAEKINKKLPKEISKIEVVNAYINFFVNKESFFQNVIYAVIKEKEKYGSLNLGKGKKVLIEHTSINPNASPHVGRIRNAFIGDGITRILKFQNFNVEVHYYVNDVSKQVALLACACKGNEKFKDMLKIYVKASKKADDKKIFEILQKFEKGDKQVREKIKKIVDCCVKGQIELLSQLGIEYDKIDYESSFLEGSILNDILKKLEKTRKVFKDENGRLILNQEGTGLENEMKSAVLVLTRSDGTGLYVLRDLAYTIEKLKRAPLNILILGEDQKLYFKQLSNALSLLGYNSPTVVHYSFVLLQTEEGKKKMSTRKGELVLLEDFLNEARKKAEKEMKKRKSKGNADAVALAAIKYSILKIEENKNVIFSWKEALNFEGDSGPYLQYAHARCNSILKKLGNEKLEKESFNSLEDKEVALIKVLQEFQDICENAAIKFRPHLLATYLFKLARAFNDFYESCPVLQAEKGIKERRVLLVKATKQVLANALNLLGIEALEVM